MPADRQHEVSSHVLGSAPAKKPSSGPALMRNQACLTCRSRKVRCDAAKPACGACRKTAIVRHEDPDLLICTYDDSPEDVDGQKAARSRSSKKVNQLENRVAELEQMLRNNASTSFGGMPTMPTFANLPPGATVNGLGMPLPGMPNIPVPGIDSPGSSGSFSQNNISTQPTFDLPLSQSQNTLPGFMSSLPTSLPSSMPSPLSALNPSERQGVADSGSLNDLFGTRRGSSMPSFDDPPVMDDSFLTLLYPNWPPDLPSPQIVNSLCEMYFRSKSCALGMVNKARFMTSLTLSPSHQSFPSTALIHAICGVACLFNVNDPLELSKESYWTADVSAAEYHLKLAKVHIDDAIVRGKKLFQVAQAIVLTCFCSYSSARFVEVWLYTSLATRISTPLGLNHLEGVCQGAGTPEGAVTVVKPALLDPPIDEIERYERAVTFWLAFCCDRFASSNTGWAQSLAEDDITTLLPNEQTATANTPPSIEHHDCLDLRSPSFLSSHPPSMIRSQGMLFKSMVLLSRINCFLQRAPYPIGHRTTAKASNVVPDLRETPAFKRLDADSVAFRLSFPRDLRNAFKKDANGLVDSNLVLAHQVAHTATILLHEAWCTTDAECPSMQRCLTSAKAILAYLVHENAAELALLNPFITFTWSVAGRTLVREMAIQEHNKKGEAASMTRLQIERVLHGLTETARSPLSLTCAGQLRYLLADPSKTLPRFGVAPAKDNCPELFDENAPPPMFLPHGGTGALGGVHIQQHASRPHSVSSGSTPSAGQPATPGRDPLEAANAFLLELEQDQQRNKVNSTGKDLSAEQIRALLEPWATGEVNSPSATYWSMLTD